MEPQRAVQTLYPSIYYRDALAAVDWLGQAFGFQKHEIYLNEDGTPAHIELCLGSGIIFVGTAPAEVLEHDPSLNRLGLYVAVDQIDAHCEQARAAGAEIVSELKDTDYGSRDYAARDLDGNLWYFGTYRPDPTVD